MNRRIFLKQAGTASAFISLSGSAFSQGAGNKKSKNESRGKLLIKSNDIIVFTGDSITDGFREYKNYRVANSIRALGNGYVQLVASKLNYAFVNKKLKIYNTGVNGDTVIKLLSRVDRDIIDLKPTIVSLLVGVNDFNVAFTDHKKGDPEKYEEQYRKLLTKIKTALPNVRFVIGEPYAIKGAREQIDAWYPDFLAYRVVAKKLSEEFDAVFIPYQTIYDKAKEHAVKRYYSTDGIHPSLAGIGLMADAWFSIVNDR